MRSKIITFIYTVFILFFASVVIHSLSLHQRHYVFDSILSAFFLTLFYIYYSDLNFDAASFVFMGIGMSMHNLGRFGFYGKQVFGLNWDIYTHTVISFAMAVVLYNALLRRINLNKKWIYLIIFLVTIGIALIGEFIEFSGTIFLKDGQGLLGLESEAGPFSHVSIDYWDTMSDLAMNALGGILGILYSAILNRKFR
ncbi:MAG: hypothetical protein EHM85_01425 [Desulfobacteraceae bacterium]|nr:MAG: hypothetical protein EHM85_01425 [Desulfobacteraceae bacterium]